MKVAPPASAPPDTAAGPTAPGRIGSLDGLRGLAILGVIAFHCDVLFNGQYGTEGSIIISRLLGTGWIGVQLFFVLSGFLITSILLERKREYARDEYLRGFYLRRALRILPLYYGFLLLYFLALRELPGLDTPTPLYSADSASLFLFYYNNRAALLDHSAPVLHMYWSLCVEEQFYLLWPFLVWYVGSRGLRRTCGLILVGALVFRLWALRLDHGMPLAYLATPSVLDGPALGALIALLRDDAAIWRRVVRASGWLMAAFFGAWAVVVLTQGHFFPNIDARYENPPVRHDSHLIETWGITVALLFFGALLIYVLGRDSPAACQARRWLTWRPLRSIGFYSYAMYMFHRVVMRVLDHGGKTWLPGYSGYAPTWAKPVAVLVVVAATYALARVSFVLWEQPFLRLRNRWWRTAFPARH